MRKKWWQRVLPRRIQNLLLEWFGWGRPTSFTFTVIDSRTGKEEELPVVDGRIDFSSMGDSPRVRARYPETLFDDGPAKRNQWRKN